MHIYGVSCQIMILCNFRPIFPQKVNPAFSWFVLLCLQYLPACANVSPNVQWNMVMLDNILVGHVNFMLFFYFSFVLGTQRECGYLRAIPTRRLTPTPTGRRLVACRRQSAGDQSAGNIKNV